MTYNAQLVSNPFELATFLRQCCLQQAIVDFYYCYLVRSKPWVRLFVLRSCCNSNISRFVKYFIFNLIVGNILIYLNYTLLIPDVCTFTRNRLPIIVRIILYFFGLIIISKVNNHMSQAHPLLSSHTCSRNILARVKSIKLVIFIHNCIVQIPYLSSSHLCISHHDLIILQCIFH